MSAARSPYPGLYAFQDNREDQRLFFGRDDEAEGLTHQVCSERLTLLYGKSGLGKTSMINARLVLMLREHGHFPFIVRLANHDLAGFVQAVSQQLKLEAERLNLNLTFDNEAKTLWDLFGSARLFKGRQRLRPVLIIDQFEEIFTRTRVEDRPAYAAILDDLASVARGRMPAAKREEHLKKMALLFEGDPEDDRSREVVFDEHPPEVKLLLSMREDFLPELESLRSEIPGILRNTFRLLALTPAKARVAIEGPAEAFGALDEKDAFEYEPGVVDTLLEFLGTEMIAGKKTAGGNIEPIQLQILCSEINARRVARKSSKISAKDVGGAAGMQRILRSHYAKMMRMFPVLRAGWSARRFMPFRGNGIIFHSPRRCIRNLCERGLITPSGRRNTVMRDMIRAVYGVPDHDLEKLLEVRLLRREFRIGSDFFELSHDSLLNPIIAKRRHRRWRTWMWIMSMPLLLAGFVFGMGQYQKYMIQQAINADRDSIQYKSPSIRERADTAKTILAKGGSLAGLRLQYANLAGIKGFRIDFSGADLSSAIFDSATINESIFDRAELNAASFSNATLSGSSFVGANLRAVVFRDALLREAKFDEAVITGADFTGADLTMANFSSAKIDDAIFEGAEWWFARSWSMPQFKYLSTRYPAANLVKSEKFRSSIETLDRSLVTAKASEDKASILNLRSWHRAIRQVDLQVALADAEHSVALFRKMRQPELVNALDTQAYVLLSLHRDPEALALLEEAMDLHKNAHYSSLTYNVGELFYHLSIAIARVKGARAAVEAAEEARRLGYVPSYEQLITVSPAN